MRIAALSNVNLDLLIDLLGKRHEVFAAEGYGAWVSYALNREEKLAAFAPKVIFLILDGRALFESVSDYAAGQEEIERCFGYIEGMAQNYPESMLAVSTIDVIEERLRPMTEPDVERMWEADWRHRLYHLAGKRNNILPFDLKAVAENCGRAKLYSEKMWYMGSIPYGIKGYPAIADAIDRCIATLETTRKKVLVVDLDNTLWGGVVGEDGAQGIVLSESLIGAAYRDAQKRIQELGKLGTLLAIVSKNNPEDVHSAFAENPHMVLRESDFVSIKANWKPKSENIRELAEELNLGLDAFVFLDDNEVEREEVRVHLPEVTVAEFPRDVAALPEAIRKLYAEHFACVRRTKEDGEKAQQYRQEAERKRVQSASASMEAYLRSLRIEIRLGAAREEQYARIVQLTNKTNQFNTNALRMDMQQFTQYLWTPGNAVYAANVSDRYGDSGLVAVLMAHREDDEVRIDNYLMSCRVMGRQIEDAVIGAFAARMEREGVRMLRASYVATAKNLPVAELWDRLGFAQTEGTDKGKQYAAELPLKGKPLLEVTWEN